MTDKAPASRTGQQEEWKPIAGYEGLYEVSNRGRVRSLHRPPYGRVLKPIPRVMTENLTYAQVGLCKHGVSRVTHIHRLVALAFIPNPDAKPQVNHKDGNGMNNDLDNLEWATISENGLHAYRVLGREVWQKGMMGGDAPCARPVLQKTLDGTVVKLWPSIIEAEREGGFVNSCVTRTCQGENKTHKGFKWEYAA